MLNLRSCNNCDIVVTSGQAISDCQNTKVKTHLHEKFMYNT